MQALEEIVRWGVLASFGYLLVTYAAYAALVVASAAEHRRRESERRAEDFQTLSSSRFTIPVSVVAAVYNEEPVVVSSIRSLVEQDYPEHEVIVIDDGSTDGTFRVLEQAFALEPRPQFVRRVLDTRQVLGIYRSATDPRVTVVRKVNGGKADALNCGINLARYRYVAGVDGDTVFHRDALLRGMRPAVHAPGRVLGVTSHISISFTPEEVVADKPGERRVDRSLLSNFQHLDYLRSFYNNRLGWTRLGFMLCSVGAFQLWRRDVLLEVGGFSDEFTCEDIELTFRVHEKYRREGRPYEIISLPDTVGATEGPRRVQALVKQRSRWQRVILETLWAYRRMFLNRRYGAVGLLGVPFYVLNELLAPVFEALSVVLLVTAAVSGILDWREAALAFTALTLMTSVLTSCAVLLEDRTSRSYRVGHLLRLMLVAPLDLFLYRPIIFWARFRGSIDFLRGRRDWDKFERNPRPPAVVHSSAAA